MEGNEFKLKDKKIKWSEEMTLELIVLKDYVEKIDDNVNKTSKFSRNNHQTWKEIASKINNKFQVDLKPSDIKEKWSNLLRTYKVNEKKATTFGDACIRWPFYFDIKNVLGSSTSALLETQSPSSHDTPLLVSTPILTPPPSYLFNDSENERDHDRLSNPTTPSGKPQAYPRKRRRQEPSEDSVEIIEEIKIIHEKIDSIHREVTTDHLNTSLQQIDDKLNCLRTQFDASKENIEDILKRIEDKCDHLLSQINKFSTL